MHPLTLRNLNLLKRKKELCLSVIKRRSKNSLSHHVISKKIKPKLHPFENKNLFFNLSETLVDKPLPKNELNLDPLKDKLASLILKYNEGNQVENLYQEYILGNKLHERTYQSFHNKLSAKIDVLKIISVDQGKNIALVPNLVAKFLCLLTYSVEMASSHILHALGAGARHGINKISEARKIHSSKNKLAHCITDDKFINLLSILLTKMHALDISQQKDLDEFVNKHFKEFWELFKKQAKLFANTENLNSFWSTCLFIYFKELKSPALQENFVDCLNNMIETLQAINYSGQLKNIIAINLENHIAFFQLFARQTAEVQCYITQVLEQLIQAANTNQSNGFWQNNNTRLCYAESSPRFIACH